MTPELQSQLRAALLPTADKLNEVVRRLVHSGDPAQIVVFGSRARGDHSPDSDLDIAVILDNAGSGVDDPKRKVGSWLLEDVDLKLDLLVTDLSHFNTFRQYPTSVHYSIDTEGLVLYDRARDTSANSDVVEKIVRGRDRAERSRIAA